MAKRASNEDIEIESRDRRRQPMFVNNKQTEESQTVMCLFEISHQRKQKHRTLLLNSSYRDRESEDWMRGRADEGQYGNISQKHKGIGRDMQADSTAGGQRESSLRREAV